MLLLSSLEPRSQSRRSDQGLVVYAISIDTSIKIVLVALTPIAINLPVPNQGSSVSDCGPTDYERCSDTDIVTVDSLAIRPCDLRSVAAISKSALCLKTPVLPSTYKNSLPITSYKRRSDTDFRVTTFAVLLLSVYAGTSADF